MIPVRPASKSRPDALALFAFEGQAAPADGGLTAEQARKLSAIAKEDGFSGKDGEVYTARLDGAPAGKVLLLGLGRREKAGAAGLRKAAAAAVKRTLKHHKLVRLAVPALPKVGPADAAGAVAEGARLGSYRFDQYRTVKPEDLPDLEAIEVLAPKAPPAALKKALARAEAVSDAIAMVRDLVNLPPSDKRPDSLGDLARRMSGPRVKVEVLKEDQIRKLGMGALLGVARGSTVPPVFIHAVYKGPGAKRKVAIVGKGITFDSGGLSLKPPQSMETMKDDMAGAATVLAVLSALPRLGTKAEVHAFAPVTYNMPGPDATKPGDVLKAYNGKTIEVLNTDAEGRLVLADALAYASKLGFDEIIDLATLTGACVVAVGSSVTAAMTNNARLLTRLMAASERAGERMWELPLVPDYMDGLKSKIADLQNITSARGEAGTIIGGLFLQEFVDSAPWVHLDIASTAWANKDTALCPSGGTGVMVRTLIEHLN